MFHFALLLPVVLAETPVFLVEIVGAVIALVRYNRHPRASVLTVLGLLLMLVARFVRVIAASALPILLAAPRRAILNLYDATIVLLVIGEAVGLALVVAAAFASRAPAPVVVDKTPITASGA